MQVGDEVLVRHSRGRGRDELLWLGVLVAELGTTWQVRLVATGRVVEVDCGAIRRAPPTRALPAPPNATPLTTAERQVAFSNLMALVQGTCCAAADEVPEQAPAQAREQRAALVAQLQAACDDAAATRPHHSDLDVLFGRRGN